MRLFLGLFLLLAPFAAPRSAQSLWTIDAGGQVTGQTGPAAGPCSYPLGPLTALWSYLSPGPCATPGATGGAGDGIGGLGIDRATDQLWITDGFVAAAYATYSTPVITGVDVALVLAAPVRGIDWDPSLGGIWITDGAQAALATIVFNGTCFDAVLQTSFTLPIAGAATALSHDPMTDALWIVDDAGTLTHVAKTGAIGPLGAAQVTLTSGCALAQSLRGVAADTAGPPGRVYVTDGDTLAVVDMGAGGVSAAPTFYSPVSCWSALSPTVDGLVVTATGNLFGAASGGPLPGIGAKGQSIVPNDTFAIELGGAKELDVAVLVLGTDFLCPAATVLGVPFHVAPTPLVIIATTTVDVTGFASLPFPLGPGTPIGVTVYLQWGILTPATLAVASTRGMALTTSLP